MKTTLAVLFALALAPASLSAQDAQTVPVQKKPLYERLGGLKPITLVVDDFVDRLVNDATLNANAAIAEGRKSSPAPYLKVQVSVMVCQVTGGPCKYTGKDMRSAHAHLHITDKEWDAMAADFKMSLDKFKVPEPEQKELFAIVGTTKKDIVVAPAQK